MKEDWRKEALKNSEKKSSKAAVRKIRNKIKQKRERSPSVYTVGGGLPFTNRHKH